MAKVSINQVVAKAERLERAGNFKKAAEAYGAILKSGITNVAARNGYLRAVNRFTKPPTDKLVFQKQITEIATLIEKGEWAASESQSARLIRTFPNNVLLLNMNGVALLGLGNAKRAAELLNLALALKPDYADAHQNLGLALQQTNQPEAALKAFEKAIEFNPKFAKAYDNLGSMHQFFGRFEEAIEYHKSSLVIDPNSLEARKNLAVAFRNSKQNREALEAFQALISLGKDTAETRFEIGSLLRKLENPSDAIVSLNKAIALNESYSEALIVRGHCERMLGDKDAAAQSYRNALQLEPASVRAYFSLSHVTKFEEDNPEVEAMHALLQDPSLNNEALSLLNFALGYAHEHFADLTTAFEFLERGNSIRKQVLDFDISQDVELFENITLNSSMFKTEDLEFSNDNNTVPIFIIGMPRSGTSLTEQIICAHPLVKGGGELPFAAKFGKDLASGYTPYSASAVLEFREAYLKSIASIAQGSAYITDKMPHNFRLVGLIAAAIPEAKIVHVRRDPSATCWSNYYLSFRTKGLGYTYDLNDVVEHYDLYDSLMSHWNKQLPGRVFELDYEMLTKNQDETTRKLIAAIELDWNDACLAPEENKRAVLTASSGQVKEGVYKGSSEKWRKYEPFLDGVFDRFNK
ncbi:MAG: sulfotransferase [Paracoccaceae bacterium]|nr:sulfotransferase [Paracoccaceae bacterium]MDG2258175.1 sulfotransferase [Paracoccaceae bacterium]